MADYKKMYAILCSTIDDVLDDLNKIPLATPAAFKLQKAVLETEKMFVEADDSVIQMSNFKDK